MATEAEQTPVKVSNIWYEDDGNLIVLAGHKVFRLYKGLLTRRSIVFREILGIKHPAGANVIDDADRLVLDAVGVDPAGCAVVRLPDAPDDVEWFLSAFLGDGISSAYNGFGECDLAKLAGILRLATKYEVNFLRRWSVSCIERLFPTDEASIRREMTREMDAASMNGLFSLIDVALEVNIPWVLPGVYWRLQRVSQEQIIHPAWTQLSERWRERFIGAHHAATWAASQSDWKPLGERARRLLNTPYYGGKHILAPTTNERCPEAFHELVMGFLVNTENGDASLSDTLDNAGWKFYLFNEACDSCKQLIQCLINQQKALMDLYLECQRSFNLADEYTLKEMRRAFYDQVSEEND